MAKELGPIFGYDVVVGDDNLNIEERLQRKEICGLWRRVVEEENGLPEELKEKENVNLLKYLTEFPRSLVLKENDTSIYIDAVVITHPTLSSTSSSTGQFFIQKQSFALPVGSTYRKLLEVLQSISKDCANDCLIYKNMSENPVELEETAENGIHLVYMPTADVDDTKAPLKFEFNIINEYSATSFIGAILRDFMEVLFDWAEDFGKLQDHLIKHRLLAQKLFRKYDGAVKIFGKSNDTWVEVDEGFVKALNASESSRPVLQAAIDSRSTKIDVFWTSVYYNGPSLNWNFTKLSQESILKVINRLQETLDSIDICSDKILTIQLQKESLTSEEFKVLQNFDEELEVRLNWDPKFVEKWADVELKRCDYLNKLDLQIFQNIEDQIPLLKSQNEKCFELLRRAEKTKLEDLRRALYSTLILLEKAEKSLEIVKNEKPDNYHRLKAELTIAQKNVQILEKLVPLLKNLELYREAKERYEKMIRIKLAQQHVKKKKNAENLRKSFEIYKRSDETLVQTLNEINRLSRPEATHKYSMDLKVGELGVRINKCLAVKKNGLLDRLRRFLKNLRTWKNKK
ncbi:unnamed protein product [Bursaphelenchus xylophilus]|uniref:(pine wood nematode) hypothetical protein n=1 Tax=Bursaphelenchus xylophilus TaxID=6326 RepID=A0A1I7RKG0_BURXY|nr:unnamed protein product [Bursaphelenchus xylophilus]CAG9131346.1 unnamed protein product [Bursaphelenchus xylophilus]